MSNVNLQYWFKNTLPIVFDDVMTKDKLLSKLVAYMNNTLLDLNKMSNNQQTQYGEINEELVKAFSTVAPSFNSTSEYAEGDYCIYENTLYVFTSAHTGAWDANDVSAVAVTDEILKLFTQISTVQTAVTQLTAKAVVQTLWTPKLYDNTTYVRDIGDGICFKIGKLCIAFIYTSSADLTGISTQLKISGLPMTLCCGGVVYINGLSSQNRVCHVQGFGTDAYIKPALTSSEISSAGQFEMILIGFDS